AGSGVGMGGDDGALGQLHDVPKATLGEVGDVDEHAETVALADDILAESCQPSAGLLLAGSVGGHGAAEPGEADGTQTKVEHEPQDTEIACQRLGALEGQENAETGLFRSGFGILPGEDEMNTAIAFRNLLIEVVDHQEVFAES